MLYTNRSKLFIFVVFIIFYLYLPSVTFGHDQHPIAADGNKPCPLAEKCPYYKAIHSGEKLDNVNWSTNKCPAAGKCPYFEDIKKRAEANDGNLPSTEKGCPYAENCPYAKRDKDSKDSNDSKCPYLSDNMKGCPYLSSEGKDDKDASTKCPHFQKLKEKKEAAEAAAKTKDEL